MILKKISIIVLILLLLGIVVFFVYKKQNMSAMKDSGETISYYDVEF